MIGDQSFKCYYEGCSKTYKTKYTLARHINTEHLMIGQLLKQNQIDLKLENKESFKKVKRGDFLLSEHYKEGPKLNLTKCMIQGPLPIIPSIDVTRKISPSDLKLPVLLILLRSVE